MKKRYKCVITSGRSSSSSSSSSSNNNNNNTCLGVHMQDDTYVYYDVLESTNTLFPTGKIKLDYLEEQINQNLARVISFQAYINT